MMSLSVLPSPARPWRKVINDGVKEGGKKGDPDSEPVPGWWPQKNAWLSAECTLKDV